MTQDVSEKPTFVTLPGRGLIRITGSDRHVFLNALVSNDLEQLITQPALYACLLTPQGKFLFDFIIHKDDDALVLDCEGGDRLTALEKKLKLYKLRSKIELESIDNVPVYSLSSSGLTGGPITQSEHPMDPPVKPEDDNYPDPRHPALGYRTLTKPQNIEEAPFAEWDTRRITLCIPDGSRDMIPELSTLIESRIDTLHGVSYDKGCYIGQELTARMHHRGLAKKHLYALKWKGQPPPSGADIVVADKLIGQMRSSCGSIGLALLKDEALQYLENTEFPKVIDNTANK